MYCQTCEADVAAEVSADGKSLLCTTCGNEVRKSFAPSLSPDAKSARDLLAKWSGDENEVDPFDQFAQKSPRQPDPPPTPQDPDAIRRTDAAAHLSGPKLRHRRGAGRGPSEANEQAESGDLMDRPRPTPTRREPPRPTSPVPTSGNQQEQPTAYEPPPFNEPAPSSEKTYRIDAAHTRTVDAGVDGPTIPPPHRRPAPPLPDGHRIDARHDIPAPHLRTESFVPPNGKKPGRVESIFGQLLAYGGVGLLTVGTSLILWSYFGGPVKYAPTGWLVATVGQMLLFLGVVTLISGGMQQTTHEVTSRVAHIDDRLGRIEETTELVLTGPHFGRRSGNANRRTAAGISGDDAFIE